MQVAIGVILNQKNEVLIGRVLPHRKYAHTWEFPGGKVEDGESCLQALTRELWEELEIIPLNAYELLLCPFPDDPLVELVFFLVASHSGIPRLKEHQALAWVPINSVYTYQLINTPMMDAVFALQRMVL